MISDPSCSFLFYPYPKYGGNFLLTALYILYVLSALLAFQSIFEFFGGIMDFIQEPYLHSQLTPRSLDIYISDFTSQTH